MNWTDCLTMEELNFKNKKEKHIRKCYKLMREAKGSILYPKEVKK